jgi:putative hemolysin
VRLARNKQELKAAQALRYKVFYEEYGAQPTSEDMRLSQVDCDPYDDIADHLIVIDTRIDQTAQRIVGTYRLLRQDVALANQGFYTRQEYDISPILESCDNVLELGRSCVHAEYRTRPVMQLLWQAIAEYVAHYKLDVMFGCASFHGTDLDQIATSLSYLYEHHRAPDHICPQAHATLYKHMNIADISTHDPKRLFSSLPALIKGYLRLGGVIGDGAVIDEQFNTIDVCVIVQTKLVAQRYRKHYERKTNFAQTASS